MFGLVLCIQLTISVILVSSEQFQAPIILRESSDNEVPLGSRKVFTCNAIGYPSVNYLWLREWKQLSSNYSSSSYFEIGSAKKEDQGSYRCLAKNSVGVVASKAARLTVWFFDGFQDNLSDKVIEVTQFDGAVFQLGTILSSPEPNVQWFMKSNVLMREQTRIISNEKYFLSSSHKLIVLDADFDDEKIYYAIVENIFVGGTKQSPDFRLEVRRRTTAISFSSKPNFIIKPVDQFATIGDPIKSFECLANTNSRQPFEMLWTKDSVLIDSNNPRFHIGPYNRTLELRGITADDQGLYSCHVRLKLLDISINATARLTVRAVPMITTNFPLVLNVDLQEKVTFNCQGTPVSNDVNVTWFKDAVRLTNQTNRIQLINHELVIESIEWDDQGIYQCFMTNDVGEDTRSTWLKIKSEAPIASISKDVTVFNGTDVQLVCTVSGSPRPNITWSKIDSNGNDEEILNDVKIRYSIDERAGSLTIFNTQRNDSGQYECRAKNILGVAKARTNLFIRRPTKIVSLPSHLKVVKAQSLQLFCQVFSEPTVDTQISWLFNYHQPVSKENLFNQSTILIETPQNRDSGNYTCLVESSAGNDSRTAEVTIIELPWPPTFVRATFLNKSMGVNLTWIPNFDGNTPIERYTIQMKIGSTPNSDEHSWQTKEEIVADRNRNRPWTLIRSLRPFTTYRFRVSAWNQLGEGQVSEPSNEVTLPEEIPSGTVQSVSARPADSTSVVVEFSKPIESTVNGQLIGYNINYALNYPNPQWKSVRVNSSTQTFVLKDLMIWESYLISVSVINNVGTGPASEFVKVRTLEGIPSRSPTILRAEPISSTSISLTWQGPPAAFINGILNSFQIELFDSQRNQTIYKEQQAKPIEMYQLVIDQMKKFTNYSIRVNCATKIGHGPWSSPTFYVQTHEDVPDQIENLTFSNVYDTSLEIIWQKPIEINGILTGFELEWYRLNTSSDLSVVEVGPESRNFTIKNLSATTWYSISVRAKTRRGFGLKRSASIESGYPPEMPSAPSNLEVISISERSATIQFAPGYTGKTNILRYIIERQTRSNYSQWERTETFQIEQITMIVRDLHPNEVYRFRMSAVNVKGVSNVSVPTEFFRTKPDVPSSIPSLIFAQAINSTSIRVRWMPIPTCSWNAPSPGYLLTINNSRNSQIKIDDPTANEFVFNDLTPANTAFRIQLTTFNKIGFNDQSIETVERTFPTVPRRSPSKVRVESINGSAVRLIWEALSVVDQSGPLSNYKIFYFAQTSPLNKMTINHVDNRSTIDFIVNNLNGFSNYSFAVSACTLSGCSRFSRLVHFLTDENVPSKPSEVFFPEVDHWSAKMIWQKPRQINGILLGYRLIYWQSDDEQTRVVVDNLTATSQTYLVENLEKTTLYTFILCAKTRVGCGEASINRLLTMEKRDRPAAPHPPTVIESTINSTNLVLTWRKDSDFNYAPIRYTYVEIQNETNSFWSLYEPLEKADGQTTSLLIENLKANNAYRFRVFSENDMGRSDFSRPTNWIRTKESAPTVRPEIDFLVSDEPCQLYIRLKDFSSLENSTRLKVSIKSLTNDETLEKMFDTIAADGSVRLTNLCKDSEMSSGHVLFVRWSNNVADGPNSYAHYFHLSLPSSVENSIEFLNATVLSSREIRVRWKTKVKSTSIGHKIFSRKSNETKIFKVFIVPSNESEFILDDLTPFTEYKVFMETFDIHGSAGRFESNSVRTEEDAPGPVEEFSFTYVTFNSLRVEWKTPKNINGVLRAYELTYDNRLSFSSSINTSSTRVKTIKQRLSALNNSLKIDELDPYQFYEFSICACTIRCGLCLVKSIQTGPQRNSPLAPLDLRINHDNQLVWQPSIDAEYYLIEFSIDQSRTWTKIDEIRQSNYEFRANFFESNRSNDVFFRVFSVNQLGISESSEILRYNISSFFSRSSFDPWKIYSNLQTFLRTNQIFFYLLMILIVLLLLMFISILLTCCCCRMKLKKNKLLQSTNTLNSNLNGAESKQSIYTASTLLTPNARQLTIQRNRDSLALSDLLYNQFSSRSPPRPIPTPIVYDDLTSTKSLLNNNQQSTSNNDENQSNADYPWYHSLPQQLYTYMSNNHLTNRIHEEKEQDETDLTVAFNGAILMNNVPRSRAAVNGCSSFAL